MLRLKLLPISLLIAFASLFSGAQDSGAPASSPGLGRVSFPVSCTPEVRPAFEKGMAELHSFQYAAAEKAFSVVAQGDPRCAMAYWGLAMSVYHALWEGADQKAVRQGHAYLEKARKIGTADKREQGYIDALGIILKGDRAASAGQLADYSHALEEITKHYPADGEAQAFYGLSLLTIPGKGDELETRKQAIAVFNRLSAAQPEHPGAVHYLIHAADTPELAEQGLAAARRYAKIAPDSSHALHMPSHIFVRLGLWQESVDSNYAAAVAAAEATEHHMGEAHYQFHAMDFLDFSYLQLGEAAKARQIVDDLSKVPGGSADVVTRIRIRLTTRNLLELHGWKEALELKPEGDAHDHLLIYALQTIAAARSGDAKAAEQNFKVLSRAAKQIRSKDDRLEEYRLQEAEAWMLYAKGKTDKALKKLQSAAAREEDADPGSFVVSAREMLADMLLESHKPAEALVQYEGVLKLAPNRFNALYGAAAAAQVAGDAAKARSYYSKLREICPAQADREELTKAKLVVAGGN
jgi:tetratricopeptide (TPR) repeat protein